MNQSKQAASLKDDNTAVPFNKVLLSEQLSLLYRDSTAYYRLGMGCALVSCSLLWNNTNNLLLGFWLLIYAALTWGGIQLNCRYQKHLLLRSYPTLDTESKSESRVEPGPKPALKPHLQSQEKWRNLFTLGGILVGCCWGLLLIFLTPQDNATLQSVVIISMTGLALYASAIFSAVLVSYLGFILPAFIPLIILEYNRSEPLVSPYIVAIFLAFLIYSAWRNHVLLKSSLSRNVENRLLLKRVTAEQAITETLNKQLETEAETRAKAENQLKEAHANLEKQIQERTQALSETNQRLKAAVSEQRQSSLALEKNRQRYSKAIEASDLGLWEWDLVTDEIYHSNFDQIFGYSEQEIPHFMGHLKPLVHEDDYPSLRTALIDTLKGYIDQFKIQFRIRHKNGQWRWLEDTGRVIDRNPLSGKALKMIGTRRDITEQINRDERLRLAWQAFESSSEAIFILDEDFTITTVNEAFYQITGYTSKELQGQYFNQGPLWQLDSGLNQRIRDQLRELGAWEGELVEQRKDGDKFPEWLKIYRVPSKQSERVHFVGIFSDLTQRKKAEEKLSYLANHDDLTGLANRNLFKDRLHMAINQARLNHSKMGLILLDIDRFKIINNTLGHDIGDQLLRELAERLTSQISEIDTIARLGADEFALILDHYEQKSDISDLADQIYNLVHTPFMIEGHELIISCSMGISLFPKHTRGLNILVNQADLARNKVKQLGGSGFEFYSEELQTGSLERLKMESDLRKALQRDELCVYYQPKVCLKENKIYEAEALVRWNHPESGLICPGSFISIAEETGLISVLGEQVFVKSCHQVREWLDKGLEIKLSVNLSAQQLHHHDLVGFIDETIRQANIPHHLIELELTESSLIDDPNRTVSLLDGIRALGVTLAIDDFGTGYSSLSYLQRFPLDILKIDRSFLKQIHSADPQQATLTKAIIALGHNLDMKIVAEGVETRAQLEFLQRHACDFAQGFYISPPVPPQTFFELVENYNQSNIRTDESI
ncbi:EAL domain-containing protein [Oceanospirillum maris]|uniref:EAL domain-containing protein n=1 Tax=Oceanospirillum maris TaxID=64977 RepID=UPI0004087795|nr:EAL domain-containing protein [Oceanospirillum maris]